MIFLVLFSLGLTCIAAVGRLIRDIESVQTDTCDMVQSGISVVPRRHGGKHSIFAPDQMKTVHGRIGEDAPMDCEVALVSDEAGHPAA